MTEPVFENQGIKYLIRWDDIKLVCEVSRISLNHDATKCMCLFTSEHPDCNPHILQTKLNLESTRSRNDLAKDLATRYKIDQKIDWKAITEYLAVKVLREFERGEPVIEVTSEDEIKPLEYLIYPIAPTQKPTVIFGSPGSGKSQMAVVFMMVCCLPWHDNPLRMIPPKYPTPALFLDYEADIEDIKRQLVSLVKGMGLPFMNLHYRRCTLPLADDMEAICNHARDIGAGITIVDSISLAAGDDPQKPSVATNYFRKLRQLGMTSISLAHTSKDPDASHKTIFGSVMWEAGARSVWEIQGQEEDNALNVALFHRKANLSKKFPPQGYKITYENDMPCSVSWHNPKEVVEFVEKMSVSDRIVELLSTGSMHIDEIIAALGITKNSARVALHRLKSKNNVIKLGEDDWGLTHDE